MAHKITGSLIVVLLLVFIPAAAQDQAVSVDSLYGQSVVAYNNGDYPEAIRLIRLAADDQEKASGRRSLRYAEIVDDLGYFLTDVAEYSEAAQWLIVALEIRQELSSPDSLDLGDSYENLSRLFARTGDYERAKASFNEAEVYYARYFGKQSSSYAYFVYLWATELYNASQYITSAEPYRIAAGSYIAAEGAGSINAMYCWRNEAYANLLGGAHESSATQYSNLIELYRNVEGAQQALPEWYSEMGNALALLGRIDEAIVATDESLRRSEQILGGESSEFADAVYSIAKVFEEAGVPAVARTYFLRSLPLLESAYGKETRDYVIGLSGVSFSYIEEQKYPESLAVFEALIPLTVAALDTSSADYQAIAGNFTTTVESYAIVLFEAERFQDFALLHKGAHELEYLLHGESDYYAKFVYQQADGLARAGDTTTAVGLLEEFLEIERRQYDSVTEDQAVGLQRLAMLNDGLKNYAAADSLYQQSLYAFEESAGRNSNAYLDALATVGSYYYNRALYVEALKYFESGVGVGLVVHGESSLQYVTQKFNVAAMYQRLGRTAEAIEMVAECIALEDRYRPDSSDNAIQWSHDIAKFFVSQGEHENAVPYFESALERIERSGRKQGDYWSVANELSQTYFALGLFDESVRINERMVAFTTQNDIRDSDLWSLVSLGTALNNAKKYADSEKAYQQAIAGFSERYDPEHFYVGGALMAYSTVLIQQGLFQQSEEVQAEALRIIDTAEPEEEETATYNITMYSLALTSLSTGRYNRAVALLERVLATQSGGSKQLIGADYMDTINALTVAYLYTERTAEQLRLSEQILELLEEKYSTFHPDYIDQLLFLGLSYTGFRDDEKAGYYYLRAREILESNDMTESEQYARLIASESAMILMRGGSSDAALAEARNLVDQSLALFEKLDATNVGGYRIALTFASAVSALDGDLDGSLDYLIRYSESILAMHQRRSPEYLDAASRVFVARLRAGQKEQALAEGRDLVDLARDLLGQDDLRYADVLKIFGRALMYSGNYESALSILTEADSISRTIAGDSSSVRSDGMESRALALYVNGYLEESAGVIDQANAINQQTLSNIFGIASMETLYHQIQSQDNSVILVDLALADSSFTNLALKWILQRKGLVTRTIAKYRYAQRAAVNDVETQQLLANLQDARQNLVTLQLSASGGSDPQVNGILRKQKKYIADLEDTLRGRVERTDTPAVTVEGLLATLGGNETAIEIIESVRYRETPNEKGKKITPPHYIAFVVRSSGVNVVDLGESERIDRYVREYADAIDSARRDLARGDDEADLEEEVLAIGNDIYGRVLAPLEEYLPESGRLIISPDGELNRVPFSALTDDDDRYLIERYDISYVTSAADLVRQTTDEGTGTVVFAGPDFDLGAEKRLAAVMTDDSDTGNELQVRGPDKVIVRGMKWDPLAGAALEAEDVQQSLTDTEYGPVATYSDSLALEEVFKDIERPRILHVATHGYFLKEVDEDESIGGDAIGGTDFGAARGLGMLRSSDNPLLRSGVILAGANNIGIEEVEGVDDGWVTAEEISLMDLRGTELVVLSACESGLGDIKSGQSVQGLRQAFQLAGAKSILSTLYKVPDTETRQIVKSFYGHLRDGLSTTEALNTAQREMIKQRREDYGGAHPFFWASFIAVGS